MGENKLVITTEPKTFYFDLPKDGGINLKHGIYSIIKHKHLADHKIKMRLGNYYPNIRMETIFMNTENSKTGESHKFFPNFSKIRFKKFV